ncbi:hypothetical protein LMG23994_04345 [Cupriavidus pinatubonensis]|uniref:Uncharacterized protein n=1 Tax=Cupriavidus pinatubonensis TaxID=248026 RepID=A0ABM8XJ22_9BURK|nr:hypothetical protein LMG23994_04345 [Cupriavidus pinatubonensis]
MAEHQPSGRVIEAFAFTMMPTGLRVVPERRTTAHSA